MSCVLFHWIVSLSASGPPFSASAEVHPFMLDPADAKGFKIPLCVLASGDEPEKDVTAFKENLSVPNHVEIFKDQIHGWMAARCVSVILFPSTTARRGRDEMLAI